MLSTGMLKKPWIWSACRSIVSSRSTPTASSMLAHDLGADRHARRARAAVLPGVAEVRDHRGDAAGRGALERVDHDAQLHQVLVGRRAGRLHDEDVARAHVLLDLDVDFAVGEAADLGLAEFDAEVASAISCASAGLALPVNSTVLKSTLSSSHEASRQIGAGLAGRSPWRAAARINEIWQGRKDSNPRMSESKSDALTNLATPLHRSDGSRCRHRQLPQSGGPPRQRVALQTAAHPTHPARPAVPPALPPVGSVARTRSCEHRAARTRHAAVAERAAAARPAACATSAQRPRPPAAGRCGPNPSEHPAVDAAGACGCKKARKYNSFGVADEQRVAEDGTGSRWLAAGLTTASHVGGTRQRGQALADAFDEGVAAADEERHVGAQREAELRELRGAASSDPTAGSARAAWRRRPSCRRPCPRPRATACRSGCRRPAACRWPPAAPARRAGTGRRPAARRRGRGGRGGRRRGVRSAACRTSRSARTTDCSRW